MMAPTTPYELATASGAARAAIQTADDYISAASGDSGIDAREADHRMLLQLIERQQDAIGALWKMVDELQAEVASLAESLDADANDDEDYDYMAERRHVKEQMAAWPRPEGGER